MKLLFSDYDGTLKSSEDSFSILERIFVHLNKEAIKDFTQNGNKFIITTGKSYENFYKSNKKYGYTYDYITTCKGSITLDKNNKIICCKYLNKEFLYNLKKLLENNIYSRIILLNEFGRTKEFENLVIISIFNPSEYLLKKIHEIINSPEIKIEYIKTLRVLNISLSSSKSKAIKELIDKEKIIVNKEDIITVGDNLNDLDMLKEYNGYKVLLSDPRLYKYISNTTFSIKSLIKKIT